MYVLWFSFHSVQTPRSDGESLEDPEMKKGHVPQLPGYPRILFRLSISFLSVDY